MLIDAGANVNAHGGIFGSALCAAASKKHYDIAKALIEARAEVHDQVGRNPPALEAAVKSRSADIMRLLLDTNSNVTLHKGRYGRALFDAREERFEEGVEILEKAGVVVEWDTFEGVRLEDLRSRYNLNVDITQHSTYGD
jgi:ankyrin repeat protein